MLVWGMCSHLASKSSRPKKLRVLSSSLGFRVLGCAEGLCMGLFKACLEAFAMLWFEFTVKVCLLTSLGTIGGTPIRDP